MTLPLAASCAKNPPTPATLPMAKGAPAAGVDLRCSVFLVVLKRLKWMTLGVGFSEAVMCSRFCFPSFFGGVLMFSCVIDGLPLIPSNSIPQLVESELGHPGSK